MTNTVVQSENVAISSAPITKLKNKGTRRGSKNSESGSDVRGARKSLKVRKTECSSARTAETDTALNARNLNVANMRQWRNPDACGFA